MNFSSVRRRRHFLLGVVDHVNYDPREKLKNPDKCPPYGSKEHQALGGGTSPVYESLRLPQLEEMYKPKSE